WRDRYRDLFAEVPGVDIFGGSDAEDNCWLTSIMIDPSISKVSANSLQAGLQDANIESRPLWKPMHMQPVFSGQPGRITGASENQFESGLTLPSGSEMTESQFELIISTLSRIVE